MAERETISSDKIFYEKSDDARSINEKQKNANENSIGSEGKFDLLEQIGCITDSILDKLNFSYIKSDNSETKSHLDEEYIPKVLSKQNDLNYYMNHKYRGKCIIINNTYFDSVTLTKREGTQTDRDSLTKCFKQLDFEVINWDEKKEKEIRKNIDILSKEDFSNHDCLVICALSHGDAGCLYAKDNKYYIDHLFEPFKSNTCKTLAAKPKIFIIQACRGSKLDNGSIINFDVEDSNSSNIRIPKWTDFLMAYSTIPGYYSWRNTTNGSWFINAFVAALTEHYNEEDLLSILTITNQKVAYNFESNIPNQPDLHQCKQMPMISSTLTRKVYFNKSKKDLIK